MHMQEKFINKLMMQEPYLNTIKAITFPAARQVPDIHHVNKTEETFDSLLSAKTCSNHLHYGK